MRRLFSTPENCTEAYGTRDLHAAAQPRPEWLESPTRLPRRRAIGHLLQLAALRREHQFHQGFGHVGLETFRMPLLQTDDVGDDAAIFAVGIGEDLRLPRSRQQAPGWVRRILPRAV